MAEIQSRRAKDAFYSPEFHNLFPDVTPEINDKRFKASDKEYETRQRGSLYAVGIGGGLTGRGFELGIIDDYVANRMDANSPAISTQINDWWRSTFLTRQSPTARIIIIATRWTMNDLIGTVLKEESGKWKSVTLPAIQDGEALWPERYPLSKLEERRAEIGIHEWTALYQGAPVAHGGNRLKTDNIKIHDTLKDFPNIIYSRGWDLASTSKQRNSDNPDYTCGVLAAVNTRSNRPELWIKDCVLLREEAPRRNEIIQRTAITDGPTVHQFVESYGMQKDNFFILQSILTGNNIVKKSLLPGDKTVRAAALEPIFEAGNVHMLKANWNNEFLSQVSAFPDATVHDDVVDALSIIVGESTRAKAGILITS